MMSNGSKVATNDPSRRERLLAAIVEEAPPTDTRHRDRDPHPQLSPRRLRPRHREAPELLSDFVDIALGLYPGAGRAADLAQETLVH